MEINFLGTVGWLPNKDRQTACIAIPELGIVFDAGTGFPQIRQFLKTRNLHIFLSHYHYDHVIGLIALKQFELTDTLDGVTIYGRPPIDSVRELFNEPYHPMPLEKHLKNVELIEWDKDGEAWEPNKDVRVSAQLFPHQSGGSLGYRLETKDLVIVYITDTTVSDECIPLAKDADLLICEANFTEERRELAVLTTHSTAEQAATLAKKANVKQLVLTHVDAVLREEDKLQHEAEIIFENISVAVDGLIVSV